MTWKASLVLVALAVACGGSSNGSGGTAGNGGGAAGTGGEGGFARVGGTGGTADPRSEYGTLVECEQVEQNFIRGVYERLDYAVIPASPGEVLTITACDNYNILDRVEREPDFDEECVAFEVVAKGDTYWFFCRALIDDPEFGVFEYGFEEIYVR